MGVKRTLDAQKNLFCRHMRKQLTSYTADIGNMSYGGLPAFCCAPNCSDWCPHSVDEYDGKKVYYGHCIASTDKVL